MIFCSFFIFFFSSCVQSSLQSGHSTHYLSEGIIITQIGKAVIFPATIYNALILCEATCLTLVNFKSSQFYFLLLFRSTAAVKLTKVRKSLPV